MKAPDIPTGDEDRVTALCGLDILDTAPEERFDRYTRIAKRLFRAPIAVISLVDAQRQWFKSRQGLEAQQTPRDISFCGHAILSSEVLVVADALADERFHDNPLVTGYPSIRFYAGCPLRAPDGSNVGTLCVIDREPREVASEDLGLLRDLAEVVEQEIAGLTLATTDELTKLTNRRGFNAIGAHALSQAKRTASALSVLYFDLDGLKPVNDELGHAAGDELLKAFADVLLECYRESDVVARMGGDEFCVLLGGASETEAANTLKRLDRMVAESSRECPRPLRYSAGICAEFDGSTTLASLVESADRAMYEHKRARRSPRARATAELALG